MPKYTEHVLATLCRLGFDFAWQQVPWNLPGRVDKRTIPRVFGSLIQCKIDERSVLKEMFGELDAILTDSFA